MGVDGVMSGWSGRGLERGEETAGCEGCCCCAAKESAVVGDGVGIGFAESMESGRVRGRTTAGIAKERAMAAKEGKAVEGWVGGGGGGGLPWASAQGLGLSVSSMVSCWISAQGFEFDVLLSAMSRGGSYPPT